MACRNVCCDVIYILWRGKKVGKSLQGTLWIISETYFSWESIAVDLVFGSLIILCSVMNVNFFKLISVSCNEAMNMKTKFLKKHRPNKPRGPPLIFTCCFVSLSTRNTNDCPVLWSIPVTWTEGAKCESRYFNWVICIHQPYVYQCEGAASPDRTVICLARYWWATVCVLCCEIENIFMDYHNRLSIGNRDATNLCCTCSTQDLLSPRNLAKGSSFNWKIRLKRNELTRSWYTIVRPPFFPTSFDICDNEKN